MDSFYLCSTRVSKLYRSYGVGKFVDINEQDLACVNRNIQGTRWFISNMNDERPWECRTGRCEHERRVSMCTTFCLGEGDLTGSYIFGDERYVPRHIRAVRDIIGDQLPTLTLDLAEQLRQALRLEDEVPPLNENGLPLFSSFRWQDTFTHEDKFLTDNHDRKLFIRVVFEDYSVYEDEDK